MEKLENTGNDIYCQIWCKPPNLLDFIVGLRELPTNSITIEDLIDLHIKQLKGLNNECSIGFFLEENNLKIFFKLLNKKRSENGFKKIKMETFKNEVISSICSGCVHLFLSKYLK